MNELFRQIPSVDEALKGVEDLLARYPRTVVVEEVRRAVAGMRERIRESGSLGPSVEERVRAAMDSLDAPSLRRVINATGVVLHTNLGRAPLPVSEPLTGYSNLEYDLETGRRGKRDVHIGGLIERLVGAPGIAVNNNAAAIYLALNELAAGYEVLASRGELIEIGDGFRIPDIMLRAGVVLREVGTTNRTRIEDYRDAITDRTRMLLRVHPSNFHISGFTSKPELRELAELGRERGIPVYEDLGSGCVVDLRRFGINEPLVSDSLKAGVNLVTFSGDKLLGGPQAGILAGDAALVTRLRRNPMFRALRLDKLIYQSLETTLRHLALERFDLIPALRMIGQSAEEIRERAERLAARIPGAEVVAGQSVIGGGSTPDQSIPTWLIAVRCADVVKTERQLRKTNYEHHSPVVARIEDGRLILDLRTVFPGEEPELLAVLLGAL